MNGDKQNYSHLTGTGNTWHLPPGHDSGVPAVSILVVVAFPRAAPLLQDVLTGSLLAHVIEFPRQPVRSQADVCRVRNNLE